jgi:hypothetical protein
MLPSAMSHLIRRVRGRPGPASPARPRPTQAQLGLPAHTEFVIYDKAIEQGIRDTKDARWGFALRYARSRRAERMEVLLLLAALGTLACWLAGLAGLAAEAREWGRHFQANTVRRRVVLSTVFLGRQILTSLRFRLLCRELRRALQRLPSLVARYATAP